VSTIFIMIAPTCVSNVGPGWATFCTTPITTPLFPSFSCLPQAQCQDNNIHNDDNCDKNDNNNDDDNNNENASEQYDGATNITNDDIVANIMMFGLGMSVTDIGADNDDDGSDEDVFCDEDNICNDDNDDSNQPDDTNNDKASNNDNDDIIVLICCLCMCCPAIDIGIG